MPNNGKAVNHLIMVDKAIVYIHKLMRYGKSLIITL